MSGNPVPWLCLVGVVLGSLIYKGHIPLSLSGIKLPKPTLQPHLHTDGLNSEDLGVLYVAAKRRELEIKATRQIAEQNSEALEKLLTSVPLSQPAPTGK